MFNVFKLRNHYHLKSGFTIVELLVVIVVIGVLAAVTAVSYGDIQQKATTVVIQSDLASSSKLLNMFQVDNSNFPTTLDCGQADSATNKCLRPSQGVTISNYKTTSSPNKNVFCLQFSKNGLVYNTTQDGRVMAGPCPILNLDARNILSYSGSGSSWRDLSGYDNHAVMNGSMTYSNSNGGGMVFDGVDDNVTVADNSNFDFGMTDFSASFWTYRTGTGYQGGSYVNLGSSYAAAGFSTYDNVLRVNTVSNELARIKMQSAQNIWENHTFVISQSGVPYIKHYINGVLDQTLYATNGTTGAIDTSSGITIGYSNAGGANRYFIGQMNSITLCQGSLSDQDVKFNFSAAKGRYGL